VLLVCDRRHPGEQDSDTDEPKDGPHRRLWIQHHLGAEYSAVHDGGENHPSEARQPDEHPRNQDYHPIPAGEGRQVADATQTSRHEDEGADQQRQCRELEEERQGEHPAEHLHGHAHDGRDQSQTDRRDIKETHFLLLARLLTSCRRFVQNSLHFFIWYKL